MKIIVTAIVILATFNGMAQENSLLPLPKYYKKNSRKPGAMPNPYLRQQRPKVKPFAPSVPDEEHQNNSPKG